MLDAVPQLVADLDSLAGGSQPNSFVTVGNTTYFEAADSTHGTEVWRTDGTAAGTTMVKDIRPGNLGSVSTGLINVNGTLFFGASPVWNQWMLWKSDGTAEGTVSLRNFA